ncbi:hypothetical protein [Kitasatospora fiedleri]|nr:hypothetical protein [Kitasatospora fiedleri]
MDFVESTVEADGERLACTAVEPDAPVTPYRPRREARPGPSGSRSG